MRGAWFALPLLIGGCGGWQSAADPAGRGAEQLLGLLSLFTVILAGVWVAVLAVLALAVWRRRGQDGAAARRERRSAIAVGGAVAATVVIIAGLTLVSALTTRAVSSEGADALRLRVRGLQWWWEVTYDDPSPDRTFTTANEIHVPVGRPVRLELAAADVIHSFWLPNLAGKQDMIPGRTNVLTFTADRPGTYRAQCAEFCGLQHARMALLVVAEPPEVFERWREAQIAPAVPPPDEEAARGMRIVESRACGACHAVRGTAADGRVGPDLTHLASRGTIASGVLPNTRGALAAWIADPQTIKPGNNMPMVPLGPDDLQAVSAYLAALR